MNGPAELRPKTEYLSLDDLIRLAEDLFGAPAPIRDVGLLGAAVARPSVVLSGREVYPDTYAKAAALLDSLVSNRGLSEGNQRFGWLATAVFLDINDVSISSVAGDDVERLVTAVVRDDLDVTYIAQRLESLVGHPTGASNIVTL